VLSEVIKKNPTAARATAVEYGPIAGLVSVAAIAALSAMGQSLNTIFGVVTTNLDNAAASASG
jgi:pilus assembly protein Flp/PilA